MTTLPLVLLIYDTVEISGYIDINNQEQQYEMSLVKSWKDKQKSFINVMTNLQEERDKFVSSRAKPIAIDKEDALNLAAPILEQLNINKTIFESMVSKNNQNVAKVLSWELENSYILSLGLNSIEDLGRKSSDVMNVSMN